MAKDGTERYLLASGSRDKRIIIFDSSQEYKNIDILGEHEKAVTNVEFRKIRYAGKDGNLRETV